MLKEGSWKKAGIGRPWTEDQWERFLRRHDEAADRTVDPRPWDDDLARRLGLSHTVCAPVMREDLGDEGDAQFQRIPAFRLAHEFAAAVLQRIAAGAAPAEVWRELNREAHCVAKHIATGHGIGYEDDHICGNIVKCRDALEHVDRARRLLREQRRCHPEDAGLKDLLGMALFIRFALEERIAALRDRVWWDKPQPLG